MSHAFRSRISTDQDADEVVASLAKRVLKFLIWPFGIVLAMRSQRERDAARIAAEFRSDRFAGIDIVTAPPSARMSNPSLASLGSVFGRFRIRVRLRDSRNAKAEAIANQFASACWSDGLEREISQRLR
jgi:hypothetical protein